MTKELRFSLTIIFAAIAALSLRIPLEKSLFDLFNEPFLSKSIAATSIRIILSIALFIIVYKKGFLPFNGLYKKFSFSNPAFVLFTVIVILFLSYSSYEVYLDAKPEYLLIFAIDQAFVGIFEEFLFRGIIFPLLIIHFIQNNRPVLNAAFLSSILFGLVHFIGLIRDPYNYWEVTNTVIFATGIGFFLAMLFLRTRNILVPVFIHFLIDFTNAAFDLQENTGLEVETVPTLTNSFLTLFVVTLLSLFLIGTGLFLYKGVKEEEWIRKVTSIKI